MERLAMQPLRRTQYRRSTQPRRKRWSLRPAWRISPPRLPLRQITLSFYLRDSAVMPPFTFGTRW